MKLIYYRNLSSTKVYCYKPPDPAGPAGPAGPGAPVEPAKIEILQQLEHSSPVYTMQPVVKRLHRVYSRLLNTGFQKHASDKSNELASTTVMVLFYDLLLRSYLYHCVWSVYNRPQSHSR